MEAGSLLSLSKPLQSQALVSILGCVFPNDDHVAGLSNKGCGFKRCSSCAKAHLPGCLPSPSASFTQPRPMLPQCHRALRDLSALLDAALSSCCRHTVACTQQPRLLGWGWSRSLSGQCLSSALPPQTRIRPLPHQCPQAVITAHTQAAATWTPAWASQQHSFHGCPRQLLVA